MLKPENRGRCFGSSRRLFLKSSAAWLGAATAGSLAVGRSVHAAGSDTLKVGLVGCGGRGTGAAVQALMADEGARLVAMADAFPERLAGSLARLTKMRPKQVAVDEDHRFVGFDAYRKLLAAGVDVVLLATPPHFRPMHLAACVAAGKHVFAEKPVAVDAAGVRAVLDATEEASRKKLSIVSGLCRRYDPALQATIERIHDGAAGQIVALEVLRLTGNVSKQFDRQPQWTEMEHQMRNWYFFTWLSGDHNVEQHVHELDVAAWAMQGEMPVKAWGTGGRQARTDPKYGHIFDHHAVVYEYANGTRLYACTRQQVGSSRKRTDLIFGTKGRCDLRACQFEGHDGKASWHYEGPKGNKFEIEHQELFGSIRSGRPINNGRYMAEATMMALLGRMVTYTGQEITWDQALNSKEVLAPEKYAWDAKPPILPDEDGRYPVAIPGVTQFR